MEKLNVTKGRCVKTPINSSSWQLLIDSRVIAHVTSLYSSEVETENNATLFADALNTYNAHSVLPSQLKEQNRELMEALTRMVSVAQSHEWDSRKPAYDNAQELLSKYSKDV